MLLNSLSFIFIFMPLALLLYFLVSDAKKNLVLSLESIIFYILGAFRYFPMVLILIIIQYSLTRAMEKQKEKAKIRKMIFILMIFLDLFVLFLFKYGNYLQWIADEFIHKGMRTLDFFEVLPLGISYYCFKLISYSADVYREKEPAEHNFIDFFTYVFMFPQLLVGPIVRYADVKKDLKSKDHRCTKEKMQEGMTLFIFGLAKKVILADSIGMLWIELTGPEGIGLSEASTFLVWLSIFAFSFQLYFDFCGYSEMSNGLSLMLGIRCRPNFNEPYRAESMTDFWRRWHISLSLWFRDYVYIPLGGNRKGKLRAIRNLLVVWVLTGIWHGTTINFIIWGCYHFLLLVIEKKFMSRLLQKGRIWQSGYVFILASVGWGIFALNGEASSLLLLLKKMFLWQSGISACYFIGNYGILFIISFVIGFGGGSYLWRKLDKFQFIQRMVVATIFVASIAFIVGGSTQVALYAEF